MPSEENVPSNGPVSSAPLGAVEPKLNDYLLRLVQQARRYLSEHHNNEVARRLKGGYPQIANDLLNTTKLGDEDPELQSRFAQLVSEIGRWPVFQEQLALAIDYTPSKWLLEKEQPYIKARRELHGIDASNPAGSNAYEWASTEGVQGICLSGGGIRSATFNLGVLQGLASLGLLKNFDYLSSVSGGGYIHEFLVAWIKREEKRKRHEWNLIQEERARHNQPVEVYQPGGGFDEVAKQLQPLPNSAAAPFHPEPIKWLRRYSNYLTPSMGLFSADMWVAVAIWLRNTFLNQIVLLSGLLMAVLVVRLASLALQVCIPGPCLAVTNALLFLVVAIYLSVALHGEYKRIRESDMKREDQDDAQQALMAPGRILGEAAAKWLGVTPLLLAATLSLYSLLWSRVTEDAFSVIGEVFVCLLVFAWVIAFAGGARREHTLAADKDPDKDSNVEGTLVCLGAGFLAAALGTAAFAGFWRLLQWLDAHWLHSVCYRWDVLLVFGPPLLFSVPFLTMVFGAGLVGRDFTDWMREWLARLRAWSLLFGLFWIGAFGVVLLGPFLVEWLHYNTHGWVSAVKWSSVVAWVGTTAGSVLAGKSSKSSGEKSEGQTTNWLDLVAAVGPYVYILGLLILLSWSAKLLTETTARLAHLAGYECYGSILLMLAAATFLFLVFGWRVDVNDFSLNSFYRNRLTRCYLGATNATRSPSPLTGFDDRDTRGMQISRLLPKHPLTLDREMRRQEGKLKADETPNKDEEKFVPYTGPFPIICTTLNLTFGEDLAWQERKAASFAFTPLYSGYTVGWTSGGKDEELSFNGFVPTFNYAFPDGGINIATAVAISGAAASPNWGYHSNPATAFLMTTFDVRLGWWIRNPRRLTKIAGAAPIVRGDYRAERGSPAFAPIELAKELLGRTDDTSTYVYLSDGGHFDNMGLYELVRRRCYRILICDGEQDENYVFEGLGMAIRKCRIDFGVEITLSDLKEIRPDQKTFCSQAHFAYGTIRYPEAMALGMACQEGKILYLKSSLTGAGKSTSNAGQETPFCTEPADILNYKLQHTSFPHDTTLNQWFTESQFESYRRLGNHVVDEVQTLGFWEAFSNRE